MSIRIGHIISCFDLAEADPTRVYELDTDLEIAFRSVLHELVRTAFSKRMDIMVGEVVVTQSKAKSEMG
jgi:tRNA-binding EMAP/Myf-like protein